MKKEQTGKYRLFNKKLKRHYKIKISLNFLFFSTMILKITEDFVMNPVNTTPSEPARIIYDTNIIVMGNVIDCLKKVNGFYCDNGLNRLWLS